MDIDIEFRPDEPVFLAWFDDLGYEYEQCWSIEDAARILWERTRWNRPLFPLGIEIAQPGGNGQFIPYSDIDVRPFEDERERIDAKKDAAAKQERSWKKFRVCLAGPTGIPHDVEVAVFYEYEEAVKVADQLRTRFGSRVTVNEDIDER